MRSRKKFSLVLAIALLGLGVLHMPHSVAAQTTDAAPTLQETSDWLNNALTNYGGYPRWVPDGRIDDTLTSATISPSCTLTVQRLVIYSYNKKHPHEYSESVPLGSVTEVGVGNGDEVLSVYLKTGNLLTVMVDAMHRTELDLEVAGSPQSTDGRVPDSPKDMAPRIQKALQHAVELCRGTYTAPPETKEPF